MLIAMKKGLVKRTFKRREVVLCVCGWGGAVNGQMTEQTGVLSMLFMSKYCLCALIMDMSVLRHAYSISPAPSAFYAIQIKNLNDI